MNGRRRDGRGEFLFELESRVSEMMEPPSRILVQAPAQQALDWLGCVWRQRAPVWIASQNRGDRVRDRAEVFEAATAGDISKSTHPNAQMSARPVDRLAARLFGTHVGGGAENHSRLSHRSGGDRGRHRQTRRRGAHGFHRLREAEVQDLHRAVLSNLHVRGLQISVDDAQLVCGFEGLGDLLRNRQRVVDWDRALRNALRQVLSLDQFHHERGRAPAFFQPVDAGDVRVVQRC